MKAIIFTIAIIFAVSTTVIAQQQPGALGATNRPTSSQVRDDANQFLNQSRSNSSQFETNQADLNTRNTANSDSITFERLKNEIEKLESSISEEQTRSATSLNSGTKVNQQSLDRIQRLIDQHSAKVAELDAFTVTRQY
jgi:hypothetical protein